MYRENETKIKIEIQFQSKLPKAKAGFHICNKNSCCSINFRFSLKFVQK